DQEAQVAAGWAGVMSLPRVLLPRSDGQLGVQPAPELELLRGRHTSLSHVTIGPTATSRLDMQGAALEIVAEFLPGQAELFGLGVLCAPDGSEHTLISYEPRSGWLTIDREHSSLDAAVHREPRGTQVKLA